MFKRIMVLTLAMVFVFGSIAISFAAPEAMIGVKVDKSETVTSKKGTVYHRLFIGKDAELNGIKYRETIMVSAFGEAMKLAAEIKSGDTVDLVVEKSGNFWNYKGHKKAVGAK